MSKAFDRNLGLLTEEEQLILASKTVAIAGLGGVGGSHLLTLVRMGVQNFHIADMDHFELVNMNRQAGATMSTLGQEKTKVMEKMALDINPDCKITVFSTGVTDDNLDTFLDDVDVFIDGFDAFVLDIRAKTFEACRAKGIPAITAGPIGLSAAYLVFDPKGMSFEDYFQFKGKSDLQKSIHLIVGVAPSLTQKDHIIDYRYVDFKNKKGPSLVPSCMACSAVVGSEVLKLLLNRGKIHYAPWAMQFDMYKNRYHKIYNWYGNRNPINKIKIKIVSSKVIRKN